jgi:hypothetical protein
MPIRPHPSTPLTPAPMMNGILQPCRSTATAFLCLLAACGGDDTVPSSATLGSCTVAEPGAPATGGAAAYTEHVTPTVGGFGVGSLGVSVTCVTDGTAQDQVSLILPNLERGRGVPVGEYRVRSPQDALTAAEATDRRLAWARVRRGAEVPVLFTADAGRVIITRSDTGLLEGAYQVGFSGSDTVLVLPGARPEVSGPVASDSAGAPVLSRTVLGGAFIAYRQEADWRGR